MITAKDVQKKKFEKVKFGYSPEEVDSFLAQIENDLRLMQQNLDESNDKVQLLADKVREYKETEDDLKNALLGAQKQAREVIADAEAKAAQITAEAQASVDSVKSQALLNSEEQLQAVTERVEAQKAALAETKQQVVSFKQALFDLYKQHLEMIASILAIIVGVIAIVRPGSTLVIDGFVLNMVSAWLLVKGLINIIVSIQSRNEVKGWGWGVAAGVLSIVAGVLSFMHPAITALTVGVLMGLYFVESGIDMIVFGTALSTIDR